MNSDYLWYVSYGSNMLEERFRAYIEGGYCRFNCNSYDGCEDKTFPQKSKSIELPYDMYYGNYSPSWCGAVSFLDMSGNRISARTLDLDCEFINVAKQLDSIVSEYL